MSRGLVREYVHPSSHFKAPYPLFVRPTGWKHDGELKDACIVFATDTAPFAHAILAPNESRPRRFHFWTRRAHGAADDPFCAGSSAFSSAVADAVIAQDVAEVLEALDERSIEHKRRGRDDEDTGRSASTRMISVPRPLAGVVQHVPAGGDQVAFVADDAVVEPGLPPEIRSVVAPRPAGDGPFVGVHNRG